MNFTVVVDAVIAARDGNGSGVSRLGKQLIIAEGAACCEIIASHNDDRAAVRCQFFDGVRKVAHGACRGFSVACSAGCDKTDVSRCRDDTKRNQRRKDENCRKNCRDPFLFHDSFSNLHEN